MPTGAGNTGCLVAQDLALLTKVRTFIHEEISLLTVLYFPFRRSVARTTGLIGVLAGIDGSKTGGRSSIRKGRSVVKRVVKACRKEESVSIKAR